MRQALVRLVTPIVWRVPGHGARKLYGFAKAEQGSRIDLLQAAHHTTSLARRALYLRHALDETRHACIDGIMSACAGSARAARAGALHSSIEADMTTKEQILHAIEGLPVNANIEDAVERLHLLFKIERGLAQADAAQTVTQEEARKRMARWLP